MFESDVIFFTKYLTWIRDKENAGWNAVILTAHGAMSGVRSLDFLKSYR